MKTLCGVFLDTGRIEEITKYHSLGIIRGVTTNPTILVKDGVSGGWPGIEKQCKKIAPASVRGHRNRRPAIPQQRRVSSMVE